MLFAATVGEDDINLFKYHVKYDEGAKWPGQLIEIKVSDKINFEWTHSNLDHGRECGRRATDMALKTYKPKPNMKK
jgi:hypothetical protein